MLQLPSDASPEEMVAEVTTVMAFGCLNAVLKIVLHHDFSFPVKEDSASKSSLRKLTSHFVLPIVDLIWDFNITT